MNRSLIFDGWLAHDTAEDIATAMRKVLDGRTYTFVAVNELFGYRPETRTGLRLREPIAVNFYGDDSRYVHVRFNDQDYVCSIHTSVQHQGEARDLPDESLDRVRVIVREDHVLIEHRVPAGGKLFWVLAVAEAVDQ